MSADNTLPQQQWLNRAALVVVCVVTVACAGVLLQRFLNHPRLLWSDVIHDRNAHLLSGMNLATHVRQGRWTQVFGDLDSFRTWPPLHDGFCVGVCVGVGQGDERWAVLPSLFAWLGSVVFAYLLACKCCPRGGRIAGLTAALFVLVSPAQRAYATDVMLESLGACLTLACLFAYVVARQDDTPRAWRNLALGLTLLFLEKYNYWTLAVLGLLTDWLTSEAARKQLLEYATRLKSRLQNGEGRRWFVRQAQRPLNYLLVALTALIAVIITVPWNDTTLFGTRVLLQPPANLITIAYAVLLVRLRPWYRHVGRKSIEQSSHCVRALVAWHVCPVAIWFLWPQHLYSFLWVNSPAANGGEFPHHDLLGGYSFYANCLVHDYHISAWSVVLVVCLFLVGSWAAVRKRLRPGAAAVFWLAALAFVLTVHHPNRKSRFLHTWIATMWVGAGVGAASVMPMRGKKWSSIVCAGYWGGLSFVLAMQVPRLCAEAHAPEGGIASAHPSTLDITDAYLPDLANSHFVAVFSNLPIKQLAQWTYLQRYPNRKRLDTDIKGFNSSAGDNRACFDAWMRQTECDTVAYVEFAPGTIFYQHVPGCENLGQYGKMLQKQTRFAVNARHILSQYGCTVTVWKRREAVR